MIFTTYLLYQWGEDVKFIMHFTRHAFIKNRVSRKEINAQIDKMALRPGGKRTALSWQTDFYVKNTIFDHSRCKIKNLM